MSTLQQEYPLYPELTETGKQEAKLIMDKFREDAANSIKELADKALSEIYCEVLPFIESDSWSNFRNSVMDGYKKYPNRLIQSEGDFKIIRQQIYAEHKSDIDKDLNQDNLDKIKELERTIEFMKERENLTR